MAATWTEEQDTLLLVIEHCPLLKNETYSLKNWRVYCAYNTVYTTTICNKPSTQDHKPLTTHQTGVPFNDNGKLIKYRYESTDCYSPQLVIFCVLLFEMQWINWMMLTTLQSCLSKKWSPKRSIQTQEPIPVNKSSKPTSFFGAEIICRSFGQLIILVPYDAAPSSNLTINGSVFKQIHNNRVNTWSVLLSSQTCWPETTYKT